MKRPRRFEAFRSRWARARWLAYSGRTARGSRRSQRSLVGSCARARKPRRLRATPRGIQVETGSGRRLIEGAGREEAPRIVRELVEAGESVSRTPISRLWGMGLREEGLSSAATSDPGGEPRLSWMSNPTTSRLRMTPGHTSPDRGRAPRLYQPVQASPHVFARLGARRPHRHEPVESII